MFLLYRILTSFFFPLFALIIYLRKFLKKEDDSRYFEKIIVDKFYIPENKKVIWIHAASIGEVNSVIPLIDNITKENENLFILLTSTTLSSSQLIKKKNLYLRNFKHRFFTIDVIHLVKKFINHLNPSIVIFVDSEIWPNYISEISKRKIPLILLNGRITMKTYNRWKMLSTSSEKLFRSYSLCLPSSNESKDNLQSLGATNIKYFGNLKFCSRVETRKDVNIFHSKFENKKVWCAVSTHPGEEELIFKSHLKIKERGINVKTIIIPRHINRSQKIYNIANDFKLKSQIINNFDEISKDPEILIINSIGDISKYFNNCKSIFMGKSLSKKLIKVGGQNPIEPAKCGCKIYHGPYVSNFREIYEYLNTKNIAFKITNEDELVEKLIKDFNSPININKNNVTELNNYGEKILSKTIGEVLKFKNVV